MNQDLIDKNRYFAHFLKHRNKYFILLTLILLLIPLSINFLSGKPLLMGGESYQYLKDSRESDFHYNPLTTLISFVPEDFVFLVPLILALLTVSLLSRLIEKFTTERTAFFFIIFLIFSSVFILTFTTLSSYSLFFLIVTLGFLLYYQNNRFIRLSSLIPFILATFFDMLSTIFLLSLQLFSLSKSRKKYWGLPLAAPILTLILLVFNRFFLNIPVSAGPFHIQRLFPDFVSDFGGLSGISFFIILLAVIGLATAWRRKNFYFAYILLPITIVFFLINTETILLLSLPTILLAAVGFIYMFERQWNQISLKKFTFILLLLGILFSTLTFLDRIPDKGPFYSDQEALTWIKENTPEDIVILSTPENGPYIRYFAKRYPLFNLNDNDYKEKIKASQKIFSSTYIQDLFPLLEENKVSLIYITEEMKEQLPEEQGLLFLLKNERFKLIHSHEGSEVWLFTESEQVEE